MLKNGASLILKAAILLFIIWAANISYGLVHEAAHALVVEMAGGQVYGLYVNPLGTDAYTTHSSVIGTAFLGLELAGMAVTTALAFLTLLTDYAPLPVFVALRTAIYALNYSPGTDISAIQQAAGGISILLSIIIVALNLACASIAITALIKRTSLREPALKRFLHF